MEGIFSCSMEGLGHSIQNIGNLMKYKIGERVKKSPMWKYPDAEGVVIKITKEYVVVKWNGINGDWHYTKDQAEKLEKLK